MMRLRKHARSELLQTIMIRTFLNLLPTCCDKDIPIRKYESMVASLYNVQNDISTISV